MPSLAAEVLRKKEATISLHDLERLCGASDYSSLVIEVKRLNENGVLRPMGKETNGMSPPLSVRYRICRAEEDFSNLRDEILRLGPDFNPSGYLSNLPLYQKHRELLRCFRDYAETQSDEFLLPMSKNERSYAIWRNEKQLDNGLTKSMLRFIGWENRLHYYDTPEPFFDYLPRGTHTNDILVLENKDIWFTLRKLFMERNAACQLYGQVFDGLLYGEGKKITRQNALQEYTEAVFATVPTLYYWGDLDYEGVTIYLKLAESFPVRLFVPGYMAMLSYASGRPLSVCRTNQTPPAEIESFYEHFEMQSGSEIRMLLEAKRYIPQEICNYPRLSGSLQEVL